MTYKTNGGYRSGVSYSFSSRPSNYMSNSSNQIGYTHNFVVSYSGGGDGNNPNNFDYVSRGSNGIDYNTKSGNSFFGTGGSGSGKGTRGGGGSGRGMGGGGNGIGRSSGQRERIGNKGQRCIEMQNQSVIEQKDNNPLTEIDLAIKNLNLSDLSQNQIITQEISQLEIVRHKKITFVKKRAPNEEHLEIIIKEVELLNKKSRKNVIRRIIRV